jgi:hypothetical protein
VLCALLLAPTLLVGPALLAKRALLPADLLVQFEPWRSRVAAPPDAHWDALVWDGIAQYYPWRAFAAECLRAGRLPLWNPYQFCGTPFLANGQSAVLYPLNLLFWLLPTTAAFGWSAWLHLVLAGWFSYLFLRRIGVGRFGSVCAGLVWQANSFSVAWLHLPTVLCTAAWLPLILLFCERALVTGRARYAAAAGLALGLSYLGGHPHIFLLVGVLAGCYLIARGLSAELKVPLWRRLWRLGRSAAVLVGGAGLAAAQLLPTLGLLAIAHRGFVPGPDSYAAFLSRSAPLSRLAGLLFPHPFGHPALGTYLGPENYAEYCLYVGVAALAFALWAGLACRTWHAHFFAAALVLSILVALGTQLNWPLYHWLPGLARAGGPSRTLLLSVFSLSVLAGIGVDAIMRRVAARRRAAQAAPILLLALVAQAAFLWWDIAGQAMASLQPALAPLARVEFLRAVAVICGAVVCVLFARAMPLRRIAQVGLLAILTADLLLAARHHVHVVTSQWAYPAAAKPHVASGRVVGNAADWPLGRVPRAVLPPNAATVYHLRDVFGYDSLYLARYRDFASLIQGGDPSPPANGNLLLARLGPEPSYGLDMLSFAGVGTVLSPTPVPGLSLERAGAFDTYRNPYVWPRAWVAESAVFEPTHREAFVALARLGPHPDCVIITGPDQPAPDLPPAPRPVAELRDPSPNSVVVDLPRGGGGYLLLADSYAPGWRAFWDEGELPVRVANVAFRAVPLPREATSVVFRYEPASFRVGLFLTLTTLAFLCGAGGYTLAYGARRS